MTTQGQLAPHTLQPRVQQAPAQQMPVQQVAQFVQAMPQQVQPQVAAAVQRPGVFPHAPQQQVAAPQTVQQAQQLPQTQQGRPSFWDPDLHIPGEGQRTGCTVFLFGPLGSIKTTWAGSWPSPVFLSAGVEGGDDALSMLPSLLNLPKPPVYQITSTKMMRDKVEYICRMYQQYGWKTVVIDSLTFYFDIYIREVIMRYQDLGKAPQMQKQDWGFLEAHIVKELAQRLHGTALNVIWIALQRELWSAPDRAGERHMTGLAPMLQGAAKSKLPAMCKLVIHADKQMVPGNGGMVARPIYHTAPTLLTKDWVRHKYGNAFSEGTLVDPDCGTWPTFRAIDSRIGQFIYK